MKLGVGSLLLFAGLATSALADSCTLLPMAEQLQQPTVRANEPQHTELKYRRQLLRFANGFYGALSQDILRGEGEHLQALQRLMGSVGDGCLDTYRQLLLQETNGLDFALALWLWRTNGEINTAPAQDWGGVTD
ncbi:MAG: hypothetical protein R3E61_00720 [Pseudomonadales bacterium]